MWQLIELLCVYYTLTNLIAKARSVPETDINYNSLMWGPILVKRGYFSFLRYLARFQVEFQADKEQFEGEQ